MAGGSLVPGFDLNQLRGPLDSEEVRKRQEFELDVVLSSQVHRIMVEVGDILISCTTNESFFGVPEREKLAGEAADLYAHLARKKLVITRRLNKMLGTMGPFSGKDDSLFGKRREI